MTTAEQLLAERCQATHEAIKEGRTALEPFGERQLLLLLLLLPDKPALLLYECPHCGTTISQRKKETTMTKKKMTQEQHEASVVETMTMAQQIAELVFGAQWNTHAVEEIADYLEIVGDPAEFKPDLERIFGYAQKVYKTETPTPEQVFGLFDRIYEDSDE